MHARSFERGRLLSADLKSRELIAQQSRDLGCFGHGQPSPGERGLGCAMQLGRVQDLLGQQYPEIEVILHAGVGHAQLAHCVKLLGHHGVLRIGPQLWSRQIR